MKLIAHDARPRPSRPLHAIGALVLLTLFSCSGGEENGTPGAMGGTGAIWPGSGGSASGAASGGGGTSGGSSQGGSGGVFQAGAGGLPQAGSGGSAPGGSGGGGETLTPGHTLYVLNCAVCHGERGVGAMFAPEIQHPIRDYSTWVVRNGRAVTSYPKPMEKVGPDKLPDDDLDLIWNYLDEPPQPTTGQALYLDYCGNCHGADGQGGPTMRPIVNELGELKMQVRNGAHLGEFDMRREYMPAIGSPRLTDAELQLIYDYVQSL
jgi:mono/diheme cytochrome c family protein